MLHTADLLTLLSSSPVDGRSNVSGTRESYGVFSVSKFERSYTILMRSVRNFMRSVSWFMRSVSYLMGSVSWFMRSVSYLMGSVSLWWPIGASRSGRPTPTTRTWSADTRTLSVHSRTTWQRFKASLGSPRSHTPPRAPQGIIIRASARRRAREL